MAIKSILRAAFLVPVVPAAACLASFASIGCGGEDAQVAPQTPPPPAPEPPPPAPVADTPPPKPSMLETQIAFEKSFIAHLTDADALSALYAPDAVAWTIGEPEQRGRDAIREGIKKVNATFPDLKAADVRMWTKGNTLVLQWVSAGTEKTTGKPASISGCEVFTFNDDGLVATDHTYYDAETVLEQIGAYKGQKPAPALLPLPSGPVEMHNAKNDATEQTNGANLTAANIAWFKKDDKTFLGFIDDGITTYGMSDGGLTPHDKKHMIAGMAAGRKAVDWTSYKDTNVIAVEDFTIDEAEGTLTQKAAFNFDKIHIPNTKKSATVHSVEIDQWKDGKIVKSWNWSSDMEMDAQLGIGPAAPAAKPAAKPVAKK